MKVEIEIRRPAKTSPTKGTLSWLLENISHVKMGTTKKGNNAAWLMAKDGTAITILCLQNASGDDDVSGSPVGGIEIASRSTGDHRESYHGLWTNLPLTEAAYKVVSQLALAARQEIRAWIAEQDDIGDDEVEAILLRVKDRDAAAMSRSLRDDPVALPALRDRLQEVAHASA